jgi:hypothetical protein
MTIAAIFNGIRNACDGIVSQHFLLSAAARTLSLSAVARLSDEEAHAKFVAIRWANNGGQPYYIAFCRLVLRPRDTHRVDPFRP